MRRSDSPPPVPPRFVAFARRYPGRIRVSLPGPPDAPAEGLELVTRYLPPGFAVEATGPPRFLGNPAWTCPALRPRRDRGARPLRRRDAAFRRFNNVGSRDIIISGLNHTARSLAVYASQPGSPRHHARLASGCWPSSAGRGWLPAGFHREVSAIQSLPPLPSFPGALKGQFLRRSGFTVRSQTEAALRASVRHTGVPSADDADARKWASGHGLGSHQGSRSPVRGLSPYTAVGRSVWRG